MRRAFGDFGDGGMERWGDRWEWDGDGGVGLYVNERRKGDVDGLGYRCF